MTGIARLWRNWDGYRCLDTWAGVITLAMEAVCDCVRLAIGPVSCALYLVRRDTGS